MGVNLRAVMLDQWVLTYSVDPSSLLLYFNTFQVSECTFCNDQLPFEQDTSSLHKPENFFPLGSTSLSAVSRLQERRSSVK